MTLAQSLNVAICARLDAVGHCEIEDIEKIAKTIGLDHIEYEYGQVIFVMADGSSASFDE